MTTGEPDIAALAVFSMTRGDNTGSLYEQYTHSDL